MIVVLSGGVGAARMLRALSLVMPPEELVAVVNTGDDLELYALAVSPDLDTVTYTLAGAINEETGWGLTGESFSALGALARYAVPTWFGLGDKDLATHLYRTMRLRAGVPLSTVTAEIAAAWGVKARVLPMSDGRVRTKLALLDGEEIDFQEYFVQRRHEVAVASVRFDGVESVTPAPGVIEALRDAELVVVAPSNPIVSIGPILAVPGLRQLLQARRASVVAVSPIIGGRALKGPADRLLVELGGEASALGVATHLREVVGSFVIDNVDAPLVSAIEALGIRVITTETIMRNQEIS
ncbi:MAG TPA: 2-phospho-L-lactate transferase, partial [Acidimicrobiales bacterium]|nr:2-phospho-L-lactate transferase [Acidimicrobiales bacterium]